MGRGGGCWPAGGGEGGQTAIYLLQRECFNYDTEPLLANFVEFHSVAISASECSSS
jgi:hypothetical protein